MSDTMFYTGVLDVCSCPTCHISFAVPSDMLRRRREKGGDWYCPNGHAIHYSKTEADTLRAEVRRLEARNTHLRDQAEAAELSRRAIKGHLTRTKRRVAAGVCPCCNRTFQDLARHMAGQHPEYVEVSE